MRVVIFFISLLCLFHIVIAAPIHIAFATPIHERRDDIPRPRIFFITLYTEPNNMGASETFETKNGAESPCWNITLPKVSSYSVDDQAVNVTFFKVGFMPYLLFEWSDPLLSMFFLLILPSSQPPGRGLHRRTHKRIQLHEFRAEIRSGRRHFGAVRQGPKDLKWRINRACRIRNRRTASTT